MSGRDERTDVTASFNDPIAYESVRQILSKPSEKRGAEDITRVLEWMGAVRWLMRRTMPPARGAVPQDMASILRCSLTAHCSTSYAEATQLGGHASFATRRNSGASARGRSCFGRATVSGRV